MRKKRPWYLIDGRPPCKLKTLCQHLNIISKISTNRVLSSVQYWRRHHGRNLTKSARIHPQRPVRRLISSYWTATIFFNGVVGWCGYDYKDDNVVGIVAVRLLTRNHRRNFSHLTTKWCGVMWKHITSHHFTSVTDQNVVKTHHWCVFLKRFDALSYLYKKVWAIVSGIPVQE